MRASFLEYARMLLRGTSLPTAFVVLALLPVVCDTGVSRSLLSDYAPTHPHQAHGYLLAQTGLAESDAGRRWLVAAERALWEPRTVELPLRTDGRFVDGAIDAVGLRFTVDEPRKIAARLAVESATGAQAFMDVYRATPHGLELASSAAPVASGGSVSYERELRLEALEPGSYVLRVQPALGATARYELDIEASVPLAFPVRGYDRRAIQSGFGADRDGGRRAHRGVDIFADRGTEALAAVDAWVARVDTTPRGGNVVWLQPLFGNMRLYYAHLDEQLVTTGQLVLAGDVLGRVGNTGNAVTTPPHLHFGVYLRRLGRRGGARDPIDFLY